MIAGPRNQVLLVVACPRLKPIRPLFRPGRPLYIVGVVGAHRGATKQPYQALASVQVVARRLKCLPHALEEQAVLRIHELGFAATYTKERRVEGTWSVEHGPGGNVTRAAEGFGLHSRCAQLAF